MAARQPNNPLCRASLRGAEGTIFDLVFAKTTAQQWGEWLRAPLEHAAGAGNLALVMKLQEAGAAGSAVHLALRGGQHALARELLRLGASSTERDNNGDTPLHLAAGLGHGDIAPLILRQGPAVDALDGEGRTPLHLSAKLGDVPMVQALLAAGAAVDMRCGDGGETALGLVAGGGHVDLIRALVRHGADVNAGDATGATALHEAALKNQVGAIDALMELGANIDVQAGKDNVRWTPLHLASDQGSSRAVCALLRHGADVRKFGKNRYSALHLAARGGNLSTVLALLAAGASLTFRTSTGDSALDSAASKGHVEVVKALIQHGARVDATDSDGRTALFKADEAAVIDTLVEAGACVDGIVDSNGSAPLHVASLLGHTPEALLALLKHGARVDVRNRSGQAPIHTASVVGFPEGIQILLERGVDKNELTSQGRSPLSLAAENGRLHAVEVLLDAGADVDCLADEGPSALSMATIYGWPEVMGVLIQHGAYLSARNAAAGDTPLHEAALYNDSGAIDTLIAAGARIEAPNDQARTPLIVAFRSTMLRCHEDGNYARSERFSAVTALLKHGANVNKRDTDKHSTPLHYSAECGCPLSVVHALLAADPDLDLRDTDGCTPLHLAVDRPDILEALLQKGADTGAQDPNGQTPLHKAAESGNVVSVEALISAGAATSVKDKHGQTPLLAASSNRRRSVMQALLKSGADVTSVDDLGRTALHLAVTARLGAGVTAATASDDVDLLLRWGADENADSGVFVRDQTAASLWRNSAVHYRITHAGRLLVLKLLERAQQDRAWRRRGWLVLCRIFPDKVRLKVANGEACTAVARSVRARGGGGAGSVSADAPVIPAGGGLRAMVPWVVGLPEEGVFRNIMEFV